ncbi:MAG: patatin-like phospholipase family protein, partial [Marinoscillum sp.]
MRIGLVLSGGGARGVAHLGIMEALMEAGVEFHIVSGSSAPAKAPAL